MDNLSKYDSRGVSFDKKEVHEAIKNVDKGLFPKAFCKIIPDLISGNDDYCIVMHADGAGTKSSLAYAYWKETGDISVWKGIAQDSLIMNIDDLICVGAVDNIVVSSTIGRNKKLITPHMGWNIINLNNDDTIITNSFDKKDFYFVHSYIFQNIKKSDVLAFTLYGQKFPSIVKKGNIYGVQFHPEKSHKHGLNLIKNYILKS